MSGKTTIVDLVALTTAILALFPAGATAACVLKDRVVTVTVDEKAGTVTVATAEERFVVKRQLGADLTVTLPGERTDRWIGWDGSRNVFIPPFTGPLKMQLGAEPSRKLTLRKLEPRPQLVAASGDVLELAWDAEKGLLSGVSRVLAAAPYELRVVCPPVPKAWRLGAAGLSAADRKAGVVAHPWQSGPWAGVTLESPAPRSVAWTLYFLQEFGPGKTSPRITRLRGEAFGHEEVELRWDSDGGAYRIARSDGRAFTSDAEIFVDTDVKGETSYTYTVSALGWSGASKPASVSVTTPKAPPPPPTPDVFISDLKPVKSTVGWNQYARVNKSIEDNPLRMAGRVYEKGLGVHAVSELIYTIKPDYAAFLAVIGADDEKGPGQGSVVFEIFADSKRLFRSKVKRGGDQPDQVRVELPKGAKRLRLVVSDAGDGIGSDHADWAWAGFVLKKKEK